MNTSGLWLDLRRGGETPLSQQIVTHLRNLVLSGTLAPGAQMPASRTLAHELGISRSVVVRAYEQLSGEGYLDTAPGAATTVAEGIVPAAPSAAPSAAQSASPVAAPARPRAGDDAPRPGSAGPAPIDLRTGYPFAPAAPPDEWRRALSQAARTPLSSWAPSAVGDHLLREQIALHARRSRGLDCVADDVIVTSGTVDALLLIALALGAGSSWGVEDPGYAEASHTLRLAGAQVHPVAIAGDSLHMHDIERWSDRNPNTSLRALLVTPSHQFPLGGLMSATERTAVVAWASEQGVVLVEDDYDSEFRHVGAALPAIAALDPGGRVVHIGSLNKSFSPSLRCGYAISTAGSEIWNALTRAKEVIGQALPPAVQSAMVSFFESGGLRRYVARTRREYRHRRELVVKTLTTVDLGTPEALRPRLTGLDGGLHAVLRLTDGRTGSEVANLLAKRGVLVDPVAEFTQLDRSDNAIVIGYGAESTIRLVRGLEEITRIVSRP